MNQTVIAFAGRKQSGKSTCCKVLSRVIGDHHWRKQCDTYSFASKLKEFAVDVLGLTVDQVYGTEEHKNSVTTYRWENMPGVEGKYGLMTAREVMQCFGTDICRQMNYNMWTDSLQRRIRNSSTHVAFVDDVRFDNEVEAIREMGGKVFGLTRSMYQDDHVSEALDLSLCDVVINDEGLEETIKTVVTHLPINIWDKKMENPAYISDRIKWVLSN